MSKLLIHQLSDEIKDIENSIESLKFILWLTTVSNIKANLCLYNNINDVNILNKMIGLENNEKLTKLIKNQIYNDKTDLLFFNWQGDISHNVHGSIVEMKDLNNLNSILESINYNV